MSSKKIAEICIPFVLMLILLAGRGYAAGEIVVPPPVVNIDLQGVIDAINNTFTGIDQSIAGVQGSVNALPTAIVDSLIEFLRSETISLLTPLLELAKLLITTNPDPNLAFNWWLTVVELISCFYLLLFLIVGLMFLFGSFDAERRVAAKLWVKNVIIMIIAVSASFLLYSLFLQIGEGIATFLWVSEFEELFATQSLSVLNFLLLLTCTAAVILAFITLFIRYLFLVIGVVLFPIGVFLYFIPPTKGWGLIIFNLIGAAILMQLIDVVVFIGCEMVWQNLGNIPDIAGWAPATAFFLIAIINILMIFFAAVNAIISALKQSPSLNAVVNVVAGPVAAGAKAAAVAAV